MSKHHLHGTAEDMYNELVTAIQEAFYEAFPNSDVRDVPPYYALSELTSAAKFRQKHADLVQDNINHSFGMMVDVAKMEIAIATDGEVNMFDQEDENEG